MDYPLNLINVAPGVWQDIISKYRNIPDSCRLIFTSRKVFVFISKLSSANGGGAHLWDLVLTSWDILYNFEIVQNIYVFESAHPEPPSQPWCFQPRCCSDLRIPTLCFPFFIHPENYIYIFHFVFLSRMAFGVVSRGIQHKDDPELQFSKICLLSEVPIVHFLNVSLFQITERSIGSILQ